MSKLPEHSTRNYINATAFGFTVFLALATNTVTAAEPATAVFAGGCFWCTESDFEKLNGVIKAESGYTDGHVKNPTYRQVSAGGTGHTEAVQVTYDPDIVSYRELVEYFWPTIDPTQADAQFCDHGSQYRSAIFYQTAEEKAIVETSLAKLETTKPFAARIVTQLAQRSEFYMAEDYHQDYYKKNPIRYGYYRNGCGRDQQLKDLWGDLTHK
ncbi:MAG: peptide-methionine (S)-S-oxide reductase MsrA [Proteobacteria bacterium]|jgi:peptide-methionine (S)-S-oxide reductase|nr:peptide-methionine (S)-S-oxide reductase MsrA [Pseudomonadota bacterium]